MSNSKRTPYRYEYIREHFPDTDSKEIADTLGISVSTVRRMARILGVVKTPEYMTATLVEKRKAAVLANRRNGYPPKGYIIPNARHFQPGESCADRLSPEKEQQRLANITTAVRAVVKSERARILFGLPQRTGLNLTGQPKRKRNLKYYLRKRGYIIDEEKRIVYYNDRTIRGKRVENSDQPWFRFMPQERQIV